MADEKELEDIKKLPPEERISKLKELEEKRRQEIEEAKELVKQSVDEITKEEEERFIEEKIINEEEERAEHIAEGDLEETVGKEEPNLTEEESRAHQAYTQHLREETKTNDLYSMAKNLANEVQEKGYVSAEQQHRLNDLNHAQQYKKQDIQSGKYKTAGEDINDALNATKSLLDTVRGYKK
ncbi:hypothetical protein ACFLZ7_01065 [Nanoarchaeota archaeon]